MLVGAKFAQEDTIGSHATKFFVQLVITQNITKYKIFLTSDAFLSFRVILHKSAWCPQDFIQPAGRKNKTRTSTSSVRSQVLAVCIKRQAAAGFTVVFQSGNRSDSFQWCRVSLGIPWYLHSSSCYLGAGNCYIRSLSTSDRLFKGKE